MSEKKTNFTPEQQSAIDATGKTIVSASAGSGKTTVMIEKIIRLIENGANVNDILAVTFTKKAASQMKEKLCKAIIKAINRADTSQARRAELKVQLAEVPNADISTIHSFCARLIRTHFYVAGVDSAFRVIGGDDAEGLALKNRAMDTLLEEGYAENNEDFAHLLSVYWRKKSDDNLRKVLLETYENLRSRADYRAFLENCKQCDEQIFERICQDLHETVKRKCAYYIEALRKETAWFEKIKAKSAILAEQVYQAFDSVLHTRDYFEACALQKPTFNRKESTKKLSEEEILHVERLAVLKGKAVEIYDKEFAVTGTREEELDAYLCAGRTARAVANMLLSFDDKYEALKTERGVLDYNDLEHKALKLLSDNEIVDEVRAKYRYVFVDEYQDVNPVQEALIERVSSENLFLVGDVKQSIYGFRGSKSCYFTQKREAFRAGEGNDLLLKCNFRSASTVLDAVNAQFTRAMTPVTCGLDYENDSFMAHSERYGTYAGRVRLHYLSSNLQENSEKAEDTRGVYSVREHAKGNAPEESENARLIRKIIDDELNSKWYDADAEEEKRVRYSDIAVLTRKKKGKITDTVSALLAEGIPVSTASEVNICEYSEIKTLIDILKLLDNREQDVPLCSALLSPMGDLRADELANIRLAYKKERYFRNACKKYAFEQRDFTAHKLRKFYEYYERLRTLACVMGAGELLTKLVAETRFEATLLSRESREACLRRIHRFIEESVDGEPLSVHEFLDKLKAMDYEIKYCENGGEDSVKVLTMHSSKGLEYPVVILDNLSASFRHTDREDVFVVDGYALAPRAHDEEKMLRRETLLRRLFKYRETESSIGDELNLYYVALTRAKYALHMIFDERQVMPDVRYAKSFADFTDFSVWEMYEVVDGLFNVPKAERQALVYSPDESVAREIMRAFTWEYAYTGYENLPVKSSATALMERAERVEIEDDPFAQTGEDTVPEAFEARGETSVETGLAYHAFLEAFDFSLLFDEKGAFVDEDTLKKVVEHVYAQTQDNGLLSVEQLVKVLSNPVFAELYGMRLYKERQFLVSLPVKDTYAYKEGVDPTLREKVGEEMLFQGAIDLLAVGEDEVRVIDYKYSVRGAEELKMHYTKQLELYRLATAKILKIPKVKVRCTIVNIYRGFQVEIPTKTE